jgi:murein DD-endopeptidase MepM/ murein hydrolase activator NlpD
MLSVKTTALVSLVCALATVSIAAALKSHRASSSARLQPVAMDSGSVVPVKDSTPAPKREPRMGADDLQLLAARRLAMPVQGYDAVKLRDTFDELRGGTRKHEALDIMAARGTPVVAADDGVILKLFRSAAGGITVYQADPSERFVYYYAHLDHYRDGLKEGDVVRRGDVIAYVGSTGNAPAGAPHLHFTIFVLGPEKKWWRGKAVNPFPYLAAR